VTTDADADIYSWFSSSRPQRHGNRLPTSRPRSPVGTHVRVCMRCRTVNLVQLR
jgi:hypothetical protein